MKPLLLTLAKTVPSEETHILQWKYDGVRFRTHGDKIYSRHMKAFRADAHVRQLLAPVLEFPYEVDGEIYGEIECAKVAGFLNSFSPALPPLKFIVFDLVLPHKTYEERFNLIPEEWRPRTPNSPPPTQCDGIVARFRRGLYAGARSPYDLKIKNRSELDCKILHVYPRNTNLNAPTRNPLGYQVRSSAAANKIETDFVGAFEVMNPLNGQPFIVGSGIPHDWQVEGDWVDKVAVIAYNGYYADGTPRFPRLVTVKENFDA